MAEERPEVSELELSTLGADEMARVEEILNQGTTPKETKTRSAMQDFTAFALYLNAATWELYKSGADSLQVLESAVDWLAEKFLLRCPSESTSACLAAFSIMRDDEASQQRALRTPDLLLATTKAQISSALVKHKFAKIPEHLYLKKLPLDRSKLPAHLQDNGSRCSKPEVKLSDLLLIARKIPLRPRDKVSKHVMNNPDGGNVMHALSALSGLVGLAQILQQGQHGQGDALNLQYMQPSKKTGGALHTLLHREATPPQLTLTDATSSTSAPSQRLAITDAAEEKMPSPPLQPSTSQKEMKPEPGANVTLKESLARLQEASLEAKIAAKNSPMKRPAASISDAALPKKKPKKCMMKRPAASTDAAGTHKETKASGAKQHSKMKKPAGVRAGGAAKPGAVPAGNGRKLPSKARRAELCPRDPAGDLSTMVLLCCMSMARSMVQNFKLNELSPDARDLLADRFELMKEIMTQVVIKPEFSQQAALVTFLHRVLYTIRALFLDWEVPAAHETDTLETDLPAFTDTWRVQHPSPAVLFKEISTTLGFMREHATFFSEEPWAWLMQFMAAVHGDLEEKVVTVLTFDTGSVIF
eukprot:s863_g36.t1